MSATQTNANLIQSGVGASAKDVATSSLIKGDAGSAGATVNATRQLNRSALYKNIDVSDLDGVQLPVGITEDLMLRMQKAVPLLDRVSTMTLSRMEFQVPQLGVPQLSGNTRDEEGSRTTDSAASTGEYYFNVTDRNYYILFEPNRDALKNTIRGIDSMGELIVTEFVQRWANDVAIIGMRANAASDGLQSTYSQVTTSTLDDTWNGWIARAQGNQGTLEDSTTDDRLGLEETSSTDTMPSVDMASTDIDTQMFNDTVNTLDSRFRNPDDVVFLVNPDQVQKYAFDLTQREDPLGASVIMGDSDITPFSYDVVGVPEWPSSYAMLTDPENLAWGLFETMELDQTQDTDKVYENRLHSRNWLEGQFDFQIRNMQAGVLVENIAAP